jgi:pimeloyl-ACP methyl ester carboxylesterase
MRRRRLLFLGGLAVLLALGLALFVAAWARERPFGPTGQWLVAAGLEPRFETIAGRRVRFVRRGSGPAIVLLHGFASSIYTWKDVLPVLARDHDVVALDLPGFGQSDCPPDLSFDEYPGIVAGLLDRLGLARATVVGNSMGGAVAAVMAAVRPDRVERLVLVDAAGFNLEEKQRPWPIRVLGSPPIAAVLDHLPLRRLLVAASLEQVFFDDALVTDERIDEYLEPMLRPPTPRALRSLLASRAGDPKAVQKLLPEVTAPALIIWGREDLWIPVRDADRFAAALHGSRVAVLDRCGHMPQEERPEEVARLIREFASPAAPLPVPDVADGESGR